MKTIKENKSTNNICNELKLEVPKNLINLSIYKELENFKDFEYIYCIAYEMLIRSNEYNSLLNKYNNLIKDKNICENEKQSKIDDLTSQMNRLGLHKNSFIGIDCGKGNIFEKIINYQEILDSPWNVRTIDKFILDSTNESENIIKELIFFYHAKKELYMIDEKNEDNITYIKSNIDPINALFHQEILFIPCKDEKTNQTSYKSLKETIYLKEIDQEFLKKLKEKRNNNLLKQVKIDYKITEIFWHDYFLSDIRHGEIYLINYYLKNGRIKRIEERNNDQITFDEVILNSSNFIIPTISNSKDIIMEQINMNIPLKKLENEFLATLEFSDLINTYIETEPIFSRPKLVFNEARLINLPINLNLSKEELLLYISQIKNDYDKNKDIVKNSIEYIFDLTLTSDNTEIPTNVGKVNEQNKSTKRLFPNKRNEFKKSLAVAFYIYDLYKFFLPHFKMKIEKIKKVRDLKIKEETCYRNINTIKKSAEGDLMRFEKDKIINEIVGLNKLSKEQVGYYLTTMKEFIHGVNLVGEKDDLKKVNNPEKYEKPDPKYKDLIIGNSYIIKSNKKDLIEKLID